jgi:hypothetical protein
MTIKERLHHVIEQMTDDEAEATLRRIEARQLAKLFSQPSVFSSA